MGGTAVDSKEPMPPSPMTALAQRAAEHHELFRSWIAAGFTEQQALQLLCSMLAAAVATAPGNERGQG